MVPARAFVTRAGYVALLGRPNAGKSTLLNRILGEKVSITSPKPQTTRRRVSGILSREDAQAVFVDTPGLLDPTYELQRALAEEVARALEGLDAACLVRDAAAAVRSPAPAEAREDAVLEALGKTPAFLVLNKADLVPEARTRELLDAGRADGRFVEVHAVSATTGRGIGELVEAIVARLPAGEFFFDPDQLSDRSLRFLAAELVRETLFEELEQELPYASHVEITGFDESGPVVRVDATIHLERSSQKGMVIGRGGSSLKRIGTSARVKIERLAGRQVFLQLHVTVRENWRRKDVELRRFGYRS
ncbi:MAG: GTPase Era [Gemmatimonadota bacterium]